MQLVLKRRLTKVALALAVAGYCAVPAVAANGSLKAGQWQSATESTVLFKGLSRGLHGLQIKRRKRIKHMSR